MFDEHIRQLGEAAFARMITPLLPHPWYEGPVLGFDTEYTSRDREYLCFQLSDGEHGLLCDKPLTVDRLATEARKLIGDEPDHVYLISYWSIAELQFLPVRKSAFEWREYGTGSFDCSFFSGKECLTLTVFDVSRFFDRTSLSSVALSFGEHKAEFDTTRVTRRSLQSRRFRDYALHDAHLCARIVSKLRAEFRDSGVDILQTKTAASTSSAVFRRRLVEPIRCDVNRARYVGMRACWGGRAEALERGAFERVYEYDLTSAYPQAAIDIGLLPCGDGWKEVTTLRQAARCFGGFARIQFLYPPHCLYPALPVVTKTAQLYPLEGEEWVTFAEMQAAAEHGASIQILEGWGYPTGTPVLGEFMAEVLEERKKATGARKVALKLLANSLIGKLAQRVASLDLEKLRQTADREGLLIEDMMQLSADELKALGLTLEARVGSCFMPEWNALITGRVRARIGELVASHGAVYCATDAIWTRKMIRAEDRPWDLSLKRKGPAVVARTRLGLIEDEAEDKAHVAHHSIWSRDVAEEMLRDLGEGPRRYASRRPIKMRESLRKRLRFGEWVEEFRMADTRWDLKRRLLSDGTTVPWQNTRQYDEARSAEKAAAAHARRSRRHPKRITGRRA